MIRISFTILAPKIIRFHKVVSNISKNLNIKSIMNAECVSNLLLNNIKENLKKAIIKILKVKMSKNKHIQMVTVKIKGREMVIQDDIHLILIFKNQLFIYLNFKSL